jgi:hypothetical protein
MQCLSIILFYRIWRPERFEESPRVVNPVSRTARSYEVGEDYGCIVDVTGVLGLRIAHARREHFARVAEASAVGT